MAEHLIIDDLNRDGVATCLYAEETATVKDVLQPLTDDKRHQRTQSQQRAQT